jgi:hypothetical protein
MPNAGFEWDVAWEGPAICDENERAEHHGQGDGAILDELMGA